MLRPILISAFVLGGVALSGTAHADQFGGTCQGVHREGSSLVATCRNALGGYNTSSIDLRNCEPAFVQNNNGQLTCSGGPSRYQRGYGGYGGGYGGYGGYGGPSPGRYGYVEETDDAPPPYYRRRYGY